MISSKNTQLVKAWATGLGFDYCGIAKAVKLDDDARRLENWLGKNYHGQMGYMANHFDKRVDPSLLVPGAKSVITLMLNYFPQEKLEQHKNKISSYAYGKDYHFVIRDKLNQLLESIREEIGMVEGRGFVDSAPVLERAWAVRSGLGWIGKNGNMITKTSGSFFFLATLIIDLELEPDLPFLTDHCGSCTRCIDACPTDAILPNKVINGSQCISYFTIELKESFTEPMPKWKEWVFGCDVCQDVCPWNRFSTPHDTEEFKPSEDFLSGASAHWAEVTEDTFKVVFGKSAVKRTKFKNFIRNMEWVEDDGTI